MIKKYINWKVIVTTKTDNGFEYFLGEISDCDEEFICLIPFIDVQLEDKLKSMAGRLKKEGPPVPLARWPMLIKRTDITAIHLIKKPEELDQ